MKEFNRYLYHIMLTVQNYLNICFIMWILIMLLHIIQIETLILTNVIQSKTYLKDIWIQYDNIFRQYIGYQKINFLFTSLIGGISLFLIVFYTYFGIFKNTKNQINDNEKKIIMLYSYVIMFSQLLSVSIVFQISQALLGNSSVSLYQKLIIILGGIFIIISISIVTFSFRFTTNLFLLVALLAGRLNISFLYIIIIFDGSYVIFKKQGKIKQSVAFFLGWTCIWSCLKYIQSFQMSQDKRALIAQSFIQWIFLAVGIIAALGIGILRQTKRKNSENKQIYNIIQKLLKQNTNLSDWNAFELEKILIKKTKQTNKYVKIGNVLGGNSQIAVGGVLSKFIDKLQQDFKCEKDINDMILSFLCRFYLAEFQTQQDPQNPPGTIDILNDLRKQVQKNRMKLSFIQNYKLFRFQKEVNEGFIINYAPQFNTIKSFAYIAKVQNIELQSKKAFEYLGQSIQDLVTFWEIIYKQKIRQQKLNFLMAKIKINLLKIQKVFLKFKQLQYAALRENLTFKYFKHEIDRTQQVVEFDIQKTLKLGTESNPNFKDATRDYQQIIDSEASYIQSLEYIIIKDQKMQKVSFQMLKILKYNEQSVRLISQGKVIHFSYLQSLAQIKDHALSFVNQKNKTHILPFVNSQGFLVFKKAKVALIPNIKQGILQFFFLEPLQKSADNQVSFNAFLLDCQSSIIRGITETFFESTISFRFSKQELRNKNINEIEKQFPISDIFNGYNIDLNALSKNLSEKGTVRISSKKRKNNLPQELTLQLISQHYSDQKKEYEFQIVKFILGKQYKNNEKIQKQYTKSLESKNNTEAKNNNIGVNKWVDEKFFCYIPNPYASKIQQKQETLQQFNKLTFYHYFVILTIFLVTLYLVEGLVYYNNAVDNKNISQSASLQIQDKNKALYQLFSAFINSFTIFHLKTLHAQNFQFDSINDHIFNYQETLKYHQRQLHRNINDFQKHYVRVIDKGFTKDYSFANPQYKLMFKNFNANLNVNQTGLIDFAVQLKKSQRGDQIPPLIFLTKNYAQLLKLQPFFTTIISNQQVISFKKDTLFEMMRKSINNPISLSIGITLIIHVLIIFLAIFLFYSVEKSIQQVAKVYQFIDKDKIQNRIMRLKNVRQEIKAMNSMLQDDKANQTNSQEKVSLIFSQSYFNALASQQIANQNEQEQRNVIINKKWNILISIIPSLMVFVILLVILAFQLYDTFKNSEQLFNVLNYDQEIHSSQLYMQKQFLRVYHKKIQAEIHSKSQPFGQMLRQLNTQFVTQLPQSFLNYQNFTNIYKSQNLCQKNFYKNITNPLIINCTKIGMNENGLGKSVQFYAQNLQFFNNQTFLNSFINNESYSYYYKSLTYLIYIQLTLQKIHIQYQIYLAEFFDVTRQSAFNRFVQISACLFASLLIFIYSINKMKNRSKIALSYFCSIPRQMINKIKVTAYLQRNQILNIFDYL